MVKPEKHLGHDLIECWCDLLPEGAEQDVLARMKIHQNQAINDAIYDAHSDMNQIDIVASI